MQDETAGRQAQVGQKFIRGIYWLPITVFIVGLLSFVMLMWTDRINKRQRIDFDFCDALMDIQISIGLSHIWSEEMISGDIPLNLEIVTDKIDLAIELAEALLNSGKNEHGLPLQSLRDSKLRMRVADIHSLLTQFKTLALQRIQGANAAPKESAVYGRFHAVFYEIQNKAQALEIVLEKNQIRAQARATLLFSGILLSWVFVVVGATIGTWSREVKRRAAERALQKTNEQLKSQTEELKNFREHLMDLVEDRTIDLITINTNLQQEIIERKQAEKSLQDSENKCRILVDYLPQKIYLKDENSVYLYGNDSFARDLDMKADDILGKTDYDLFPLEIAKENIAEDKKIIKSGELLDVEERHVKDGQEAIIHKFKMPTRNEKNDITGILGFSWDVTERIRLESVAETVTTMNNIGYIFAGIRHEIGNPINSAKISLSVLQEKIDTYSKETIKKYIEGATEEISRVDYLLRVLKNFNMYETPELQNVEMKAFMDKFLSLLADDFEKKGITAQTIFDPETRWGYVDPRALQQVMLNIISNASQALEGRENPRIFIQVLKVDNTVRIHVTDNGCGISEEKQKRLFTPFFTTKPCGTGLGLVISKKLLSRMDGTIEIKSQRDEGTSVEISIREGRDER